MPYLVDPAAYFSVVRKAPGAVLLDAGRPKVTGELACNKDALDLLVGAFPGGSITGAPKIRAMQIIDELEPNRRGFYCGSLLYLDVRGEMDSSILILIRSLLAKDGVISCWSGGGIVADSEWQAEYEESMTKVLMLLQTLERFV